mmetsp:Transcript_1026/g.1454  ORF Transcript_1026/g.1454 Transcript_1026/m.1454 type:complete len:292 (+) Transcript_1026:106-981(+)
MDSSSSSDGSSPEIILLNVGGMKFTTSRNTLCLQDSMLARMFSGTHPLSIDPEGAYFIDRDGTHFQYILNYLRDGSFPPPELDICSKVLLEREARFFCLDELVEILEAEIKKDRMHASQKQFLALYNSQQDSQFLCYSGLKLPYVDLSNLSLSHATFQHAELSCSSFINTQLASVNFDHANLMKVDFSGSSFTQTVSFEGANLQGAQFQRCQAEYQALNFSKADLTGASFAGTDMRGTVFKGTKCDKADFSGAILTETDILNSSFNGAVLRGAIYDDSLHSKLIKSGAVLH